MQPWITWFEIPVSDMDQAKAFYEAIFGLKLTDLAPGPGLRMALFPGTQEGLGGGGSLIQMASFYKPGETGPLIYLNADPDLAVVMGRVEKAGGKVIFPKRQISPERGFMGVFNDTEGNRIALHSQA
jgi:predicted enzyme related to lactoylglutathione lyase